MEATFGIDQREGALGSEHEGASTAGFDPAVLQGARKLLAAKGAAIVYFEYNIWNLWKTTALKDVVAELETFDYVCYFEGETCTVKTLLSHAWTLHQLMCCANTCMQRCCSSDWVAASRQQPNRLRSSH